MPGSAEFGLLGPLLVRSGGTVIPVRRGHERALLAGLLLEANRVVSVERLAETLWGPMPPPSASATIRNYVRRLRQSLGESVRARISTQPRGYLIHVADSELDLARFEELVASARAAARGGAWECAADAAGAALALWRGEPLADIESATLRLREVPRLAELRLQALEARLNADLYLGRDGEVVAELQRLVAAHPLRERLHALLMLALYRCGRQSDALAAYQRVRAMLVEELGAEPGAELARLHQRILAADPALELPQPAGVASGTSVGGVPDVAGPGGVGGAVSQVPRQLPAAVACFTGRTGELAAMQQILDCAVGDAPGAVVICAIGGTAGVGKTALALQWAHRIAGRFGDGQLYVNLRGFGPDSTPAAPAEVIRGFLDALGVPASLIPPSPEAQAGLYRSLLADRQMLILLDNARDEQQVRPLLPASPASLVIVTSRSQLAGLAAADGAHLLTLDVLSHAEATQMLTARIGTRRAAAEPEAVIEIAALCALLPLALAVTAARAAARPTFPLAALASELRDSHSRLDVLDAGEPAARVRAVFSWSYQRLSPTAARMFRLLGLHPGRDISTGAAASLAGVPPGRARQDLAELTRAHLITEHTPGRYASHDLLRAYATGKAHTTDSDADRHEATGRVLDHYLHTAHTAAYLLTPSRAPITLAPPRPGVTPGHLASYEPALAWFEAEHHVLLAAITLAAQAGFAIHAWQIPWTMSDFLDWRGHWHEKAGIQRIAVDAATRAGDIAGQAESRRLLAVACSSLGDYEQALAHLPACLKLYQQLGDSSGQAHTHQALGWVAMSQGRHAEALRHAGQAGRLYELIGNQAGQADMLNAAGWCHAQLGDYQQARSFCQQAVSLHHQAGDRYREAHVWDSLGYAEHYLGNLTRAATCYGHALDIFRERRDRYHEATVLTHLGDTHHTSGDLRQARDALQQALAILDDLHHRDASQVRAKLAAVDGHPPLEAAAARPADR